ncbi:hypothetical protein H4582DRAFT_1990677 [Lactarius indigo]|nr:hypothetical protein H4582DRAFT_1990677 [Lactarius indigo]
MYAPLALTALVVPITANTTTTKLSSKATSHAGAIAGAIAGGVGALILVVGTIVFAGSQMTVTPFTPTLVVTTPPEAGSQSGTTSEGPSFASLPPPPPLPSQSTSLAPAPVGLTDKELARLRSTVTRSPPTSHARTSSSGSQPTVTYPSTIGTSEGSTSTPTSETRRLQSEMESLRREMQELRAERFEAPPSYGTGGGI